MCLVGQSRRQCLGEIGISRQGGEQAFAVPVKSLVESRREQQRGRIAQQDAVRVDPGPAMAVNVGHADEVAPGDDRLDPLVHAEG